MIDLNKATILSDFSVYRLNASTNIYTSYSNPLWATKNYFIFINDNGSTLYDKYIIVGPNTFISLHSSGMSATINVYLKYSGIDSAGSTSSSN